MKATEKVSKDESSQKADFDGEEKKNEKDSEYEVDEYE